MGFKKAGLKVRLWSSVNPAGSSKESNILVGACVLGDSLGSFTDCVLGQFTGQGQSNCSLDLTARDGCSFVVVRKSWSFTSNSFKDVVHEAVHDWHCFGADSSLGVNLLQHFVDVERVGFSSLLFLLLVSCWRLLSFASFLYSFATDFVCHLVLFVLSLSSSDEISDEILPANLNFRIQRAGWLSELEMSGPIRFQISKLL